MENSFPILNTDNLLSQIENMVNKSFSNKERLLIIPEWIFEILKQQINKTGLICFDTKSKFIRLFDCMVIISPILFHNKIKISDDEFFIKAMLKSLKKNERIKNCQSLKRKSIEK